LTGVTGTGVCAEIAAEIGATIAYIEEDWKVILRTNGRE
jgi:hypothetical protein